MAADPDFLQRLLSGGDPNAPGLLGSVNRATQPFGGATNLGLQLLANSGYSRTPQSFGQILGQSALNAQQVQAGVQEAQLKQQYMKAQLAALQAKPAVNPVTVSPGSTLVDPTTGKTIYSAPAKPEDPTSAQKDYEYAVKSGFKGSFLDWQQRALRPEVTADIQGYNLAKTEGFNGSYLDFLKQKATVTTKGGGFTPEAGELLASMAAKGVALPAGMRSKEQQIATVNSLLAKFPDKTPDEIAELIGSGQIDFGAVRKETQTAAAQAGRVAIATNELKTFAPLVLQASAAVPRGKFVPLNKLMQMGEASISDPNLRKLKIAINSYMNAYDQLASRGGTDMNKRAEAHAMMSSADSPEAMAAAVEFISREADAAGEAATAAERYHRPGETAPPSGGPVRISSDADYNKLPSGALFIDPNGKQRRKP